MFYAGLIVTAMGLFAATAAMAFAWAASHGQFARLNEGASSIFWDDEDVNGGSDD